MTLNKCGLQMICLFLFPLHYLHIHLSGLYPSLQQQEARLKQLQRSQVSCTDRHKHTNSNVVHILLQLAQLTHDVASQHNYFYTRWANKHPKHTCWKWPISSGKSRHCTRLPRQLCPKSHTVLNVNTPLEGIVISQ